MRNRGSSRGVSQGRGHRGHGNNYGNRGGHRHPYHQQHNGQGNPQNMSEGGNPVLSPNQFGPHGPSMNSARPPFMGRPRHAGPGPPGYFNGPPRPWGPTVRSPLPPRIQPTPGQSGPPSLLGPPLPSPTSPSHLNATPQAPPRTWLSSGQTSGPSLNKQYQSSSGAYRGSDSNWGHSPNTGAIHSRRGGPMMNTPRGRGQGGPGGPYQKTKTKKRKEQTPANKKNFYCETCDRGFQRHEKYIEHCDGHMECPHEGCSYVAAAKLIELHDMHQHRTGFAQQIWGKKSREDVEKWIAERKRRFPTAENIEHKKKVQAQRIARGEVIETELFGKMNRGKHRKAQVKRLHDRQNSRQRGEGDGGSERRKRTRRRGKGGKHKDSDQPKTNTSVDLKIEKADVLSYNVGSSDEDSNDDKKSIEGLSLAAEIGSTSKRSPEKPAAAGGLGSLMSAYGESDSDSEMEEGEIKEKIPMKKEVKTVEEDKKPDKKEFNPVSVEVKPVKQGPLRLADDVSNKPGSSRNNRAERNRNNNQKRQPKRKPTLLQMLLAPDIRHERNVLLQCIRHIARKNFYGIGAKSSPTPASEAPLCLDQPIEQTLTDNSNNNSITSEKVINYGEDEIWDDVVENFS